MKLAYRAYDRAGKPVRDVIDAPDLHEARETLRRKGLFITELEAEKQQAAAAPRAKGGRHIKATKRLKHLAMFTRQLYVLVKTGTPVIEALAALQRQAKDPAWKAVIQSVHDRVEEGASFHEALDAHPDYFDPITRGLIAAGESAGKMPQMLDRLAVLTRKELHVRSSIAGAMVYPALLMTVAASVLVLMLVFVLPRFSGLFATLDVPLPPTTQALMFISGVLRGYWWAVAGGLIAGLLGVRTYLRSATGKAMIDTAMVRLPYIGPIVRSFATARVVRLLGTLMDSYLPLLDSLDLTRQAAGNRHYADLIGRTQDMVTRGEPVSHGFNDPTLISTSVYEAIRNGEQTGQLGPLLINIADFLDEENEVTVRTLTSIIEPVILIVMGLLVGFVSLSMFMPLFDLTSMTGAGAGG